MVPKERGEGERELMTKRKKKIFLAPSSLFLSLSFVTLNVKGNVVGGWLGNVIVSSLSWREEGREREGGRERES